MNTHGPIAQRLHVFFPDKKTPFLLELLGLVALRDSAVHCKFPCVIVPGRPKSEPQKTVSAQRTQRIQLHIQFTEESVGFRVHSYQVHQEGM